MATGVARMWKSFLVRKRIQKSFITALELV